MNQNGSSIRIGHSDGKRFTPQGQNLPKTDVSGLIPCQLTGPGITRPTTLYVKPGRVAQTVAKYARLGQTVRGPGIGPGAPGASGSVLTMSDLKLARRVVPKNAKGVISLNTGQFYGSVLDAAKANGISVQSVGNHLRGKATHANGKRYRWATPGEIAAATAPAWTYTGPLLPLLPKGTRNT